MAVGPGCRPQAPETSGQSYVSSADGTAAAEQGQPFEYSQVELSDPQLRVDDQGVCWFEVKYRFVKGQPVASYVLNLRFPGTSNACIKEIAGWQLQSTGLIKDGFTLSEPQIDQFEMVLSEAEVPMNGYTPISNVLTGSYPSDS